MAQSSGAGLKRQPGRIDLIVDHCEGQHELSLLAVGSLELAERRGDRLRQGWPRRSSSRTAASSLCASAIATGSRRSAGLPATNQSRFGSRKYESP